MSPDDYCTLLLKSKLWKELPRSPLIDKLLAKDPNCIHLGQFAHTERKGFSAIVTIDLLDKWEAAGHWLHLSVSYPTKTPLWSDLVHARDTLFGSERLFIQLLPPAGAWLNVHPHTLHLLSRLDAETVPQALWKQKAADGANYVQGAAR